MADFADHYREIYMLGLGGQTPAVPVAVAELEQVAVAAMEPKAANYVGAGAGSEDTIRANVEAFRRHRIVPRMLRDVSQRDLSTTLLGTTMPAPLLLAPIGVQTVAHPDGELASARAAAHTGIPMIASTAAAHTIEQIAQAAGEQPLWYQLYWPRDRELARSFIDRSVAAGYKAIVVTLDTWLLGWRPADLSDGFLPFLRGEGNCNYLQDPVFRAALPKPPEEDMATAVAYWAYQFSNPAVTWRDLEFLRECTDLPIVLKGIQSAEDARLAVEHGIEGIVVSNHGGRQVDGAIGALQALPSVVQEVGERCEVLFDSGIRSGADALKALALGARAVCLGRPYVWGLALGGEQGVIDVLRAFLAELDLNMALSGHASIDEVGPHTLVPQPR